MKYYNFKPFEKVLVRDNDDKKWGLNMFSHYDGTATQYPFMCLAGCFTHCIPYEGNEHLLGTTDKPTPKRWRAEFGGSYWYVAEDVTAMEVCETYERWDNQRHEIGNYFRTREEAEEMAVKFKALLV